MIVTRKTLDDTANEASPGWGGGGDFESRLSSRTKVPAERLTEFLGWSEDQVRHEAKVVSRILKRFAGAVVQSMEKPASMNTFLVESEDHLS